MMSRSSSIRGRLTIACFTLAVVLPIGMARAALTKTDKVVTYKVGNDNAVAAKGYAVFVDVAAKNIDLTKTTGGILKTVRTSERFGAGKAGVLIGTLIVFEDETGIPKGKSDSIQIHFKDLPKNKPSVKFSDVSTLRKTTGDTGIVIESEVPRIGFKVVKDPIYSILNDNTDPFSADPENPDPVPITVHDIEYLSNIDEVIDTSPYLDFQNSYGFTNLNLDPMTIAGNSEGPEIDIPGPVDFGKWFYVRGIMTITHRNSAGDFVTDDIPFLQGQTEYVPEPSGLALAGIGLAAWLFRLRRRKPLG